MPNQNPFKIALEVRKGTLDAEVLKGAAKRIYDDNTLSNDILEMYANPVKSDRNRTMTQQHSTFKY